MFTSARFRFRGSLIPMVITIAYASPALMAQDKKVGPPPVTLNPAVTAVQPSVGVGDQAYDGYGSIQIKADGPVTGATAALFGSTSTPLAANSFSSDGLSVLTTSGLGVAGSTVPVSLIYKGAVLPSAATFSYPIGLMQVEGPAWHVDDDTLCSVDDAGFWRQGAGYQIEANTPGTLFFGSLSPAFHVTTSFVDISNNTSTQPGAPSQLGGNEAEFSAQLQVCDITATSQGSLGPCKNWDKNSGFWVKAGPLQSFTLTSSGSGKTTPGDLVLPIPNGTFSWTDTASNIAGSFQYSMGLQQLDTKTSIATGCRNASQVSQPFTAVISPAAVVQINTLPYTILYQPPGNQSTASLTEQTTYGTQFSLASSNEIDNTTSSEQSSSVGFSMNAVFSVLGVNANQSDTWDTTTTETFGTAHSTTNSGSQSAAFTLTESALANGNFVPGSGVTCAQPQSCSSTAQIPNAYALEPFWDDTFYLLVHPQFAVWVIGGQQDRYVMYGAVPAMIDVEVGQLDACAEGSVWYGLNPCQTQSGDFGLTAANGQPVVYHGTTSTVTLTPTEASDLLQLDPFYASGQAANVDPARAISVGSFTYGAAIGHAPHPQAAIFSNNQISQFGAAAQTTTSLSVTTVWGSNVGVGASLNFGAAGSGANLNEGLTIGSGFKDGQGTAIKTSFQNSTAVSNQLVTTASVTLNDVDNTDSACKPPCHNPLPSQPIADIFFDKIFGSYMFQDPSAPLNYDRGKVPKCCATLINSLMRQEAKHPRFPDVPSSDPAVGAIGVLAKVKIVPGNSDNTFHPNDPFTREQLATALATALKLTSVGGAPAFSDISSDRLTAAAIASAAKAQLIVTPSATTFGPTDAVTRQDLAVSLSRAFQLASKSATLTDSSQIAAYAKDAVQTAVADGYLSAPQGVFQPTAPLTREQAAEALFLAIRDYSAGGSPK